MKDQTSAGRRSFLTGAAITATAAQFGLMSSIVAEPASARRLARARAVTSLGNIKQVRTELLDVGYADIGPPDGDPIILLHGWPYDIHSFAEVAPLLAARGRRVIIPHLRGYGSTRFLSIASFRNGQPAALAMDVIDLMDALGIVRATLGGFDWGARTADIVAAIWPERLAGLVAVSGYLIGSQAAGMVPLAPRQELLWWYQYYFATARGRAGYERNRREFARLIWELGSPQWAFDDATFERSAEALDNPDHVDIVVHNYRWRLGLGDGERRYDEIEGRLATAPTIRVPAISMEGDANGAPHPPPNTYAGKFIGKYEHRTITGGVGHNLPQEAPQAFAQALLDVASL